MKQEEVNWSEAPDSPQMFCPRQKLFYKLSVDKKRLYVFDEGEWNLSKHSVDSFFKYEEPIYNAAFQNELESIITSKLNKLWLWCKIESGRSKRLAKFLNCSPTMITNICNGRKELPIQMIQKVSDYTGIAPIFLREDIAEIFGIEKDKKLVPVPSKKLAYMERLLEVYGDKEYLVRNC
ncbi:helix-turn-helix transcriptional regulator [Acinetobacter baumannii]|uniref:helix-turn-helix domain-containing protein n=1 Tax=Acinetobacter baumannii TaxID=470 RepID=UPI0022EA573A|nr:helix-turn-helix transcriptional regulator [Acinetobacter baumannii]MDA3537111.1 helix-turn-helix transcriptional regulator [Acinetobacter baumannii]